MSESNVIKFPTFEDPRPVSTKLLALTDEWHTPEFISCHYYVAHSLYVQERSSGTVMTILCADITSLLSDDPGALWCGVFSAPEQLNRYYLTSWFDCQNNDFMNDKGMIKSELQSFYGDGFKVIEVLK